MEKEMNIILEGLKLEIHKMERPELKGIYTKAILGFDFYAAKYKNCEFILLEPQNKECCRYSMKLYAAISKWISEALGKPVAYFFDYHISDIWRPIISLSTIVVSNLLKTALKVIIKNRL